MIIKAVLFDMGNTLIDFESRPALELHAQAELAVRDAVIRDNGRGATIPEPAAFLDAFRSTWSRLAERHRPVGGQPTLAEAIREVGAAFDLALAHEDVERLEAAHYAVIREQIRLYPEVHAVLDRLADLGVKRALVSNTIWQASDHREDLARLGLTDRFEHAVFSSEFGRMKPHPSIFQLSLDAFGVAPHEAVVVGDRVEADVRGARAVGCHAILKVHPFTYPQDPGAEPADFEIRSLTELLPWMERLG